MTAAGGQQINMTDVPQGACQLCGSRVYKPQTLECIETAFHSCAGGDAEDRNSDQHASATEDQVTPAG
jgi:hypothetical protein